MLSGANNYYKMLLIIYNYKLRTACLSGSLSHPPGDNGVNVSGVSGA